MASYNSPGSGLVGRKVRTQRREVFVVNGKRGRRWEWTTEKYSLFDQHRLTVLTFILFYGCDTTKKGGKYANYMSKRGSGGGDEVLHVIMWEGSLFWTAVIIAYGGNMQPPMLHATHATHLRLLLAGFVGTRCRL